KARLFAEAEAVLRPALDTSPDWHTATALGLVLRERGAAAEAEEAFKLALRLDPDDVCARLEAGDMFCAQGDWQAALGWYEYALKAEPPQEWALPSAHYCRWMQTNDEKHLKKLVALAKGNNQRAGALCQRVFHPGLPEPHDATANLLRQFRDTLQQDPSQVPTGEGQLTRIL